MGYEELKKQVDAWGDLINAINKVHEANYTTTEILKALNESRRAWRRLRRKEAEEANEV